MCIYNCTQIWRAARNVKNPPANNYAANQQRSGFFIIAMNIL